MELGKFITNTTLVCCVGVSSVNGSSSEKFSPELIHNIKSSYNKEVDTKLVSNETILDTDIQNVVDISKFEASQIISYINSKMDLGINDYFIPNKEIENRVTLFITCDEFKKLCTQGKYQEAFQLEQKIATLISDKFSSMQRIERVAFL